MKCCSDNHTHDDNQHTNGPHKNHLWMMLLCCGAPLLVAAFLIIFGGGFPAARNILLPIVPFLCPVIMLFMMLPMLLSWRKDKQTQYYYESRHGQD